MLKSTLHKSFCAKHSKLNDWFCQKSTGIGYPVYSSYDIRDAGFKVSNVDANIYPAGFNNICANDKDHAVEILNKYISGHYGTHTQKILLLTEEHTNNPYYWENVIAIRSLLEQGGRKVLISFPRKMPAPITLKSAQGIEVVAHSGFGDSDLIKEFKPDLIISNNDFSEAHADWAASLQQLNNPAINPPRELGWYQRKKSRYFKFYNLLVEEFAEIAGIDPFQMNVHTEMYDKFDLSDDASTLVLSNKVDAMISALQKEYSKRGLIESPFVFVKNNAGTYGLAVMRAGSGQEVVEWNYKARKKMKAAKGGRNVSEVIIQEGIPSRVQSDGITAEPVIYMIGTELAGGFLRTHAEKSATESLNSPGAVYKRLCVSDLNVSLEGHPLENVYGWSARLGLLAIAYEAKDMGISFKDFKYP